jgi:hypothetical protein
MDVVSHEVAVADLELGREALLDAAVEREEEAQQAGAVGIGDVSMRQPGRENRGAPVAHRQETVEVETPPQGVVDQRQRAVGRVHRAD